MSTELGQPRIERRSRGRRYRVTQSEHAESGDSPCEPGTVPKRQRLSLSQILRRSRRSGARRALSPSPSRSALQKSRAHRDAFERYDRSERARRCTPVAHPITERRSRSRTSPYGVMARKRRDASAGRSNATAFDYYLVTLTRRSRALRVSARPISGPGMPYRRGTRSAIEIPSLACGVRTRRIPR
jgi:hypothetical protein